MLSSALTSFVYAPNPALVSFAMFVLFGVHCELASSKCVVLEKGIDAEPAVDDLHVIGSHPQRAFATFQSDWLVSTARVKGGSTSLLLSPMVFNRANHQHGASSHVWRDFPMVRCDLVNMTRHVHHHFDYAKDGHSRTYTMQVAVNLTASDNLRATSPPSPPLWIGPQASHWPSMARTSHWPWAAIPTSTAW